MSSYTGFDQTSGGQSGGNDAVARYQYLLRTATPDQIEQAHEQAFARMSEEERRQVLTALSQTSERPADASAGSLARAATRLEVTQPGALQRTLGTLGSGGMGTTVLASLAAGFIGSAVFGTLTGGDGVGGRPGLLSRLLGGGLFGRGGMFGQGGYGQGGYGQGGGLFGGQGFGGGQGGGFFGGGHGGPGGGPGGPGGPDGHGGGFFGGGPGGPGGGGPGGPGF